MAGLILGLPVKAALLQTARFLDNSSLPALTQSASVFQTARASDFFRTAHALHLSAVLIALIRPLLKLTAMTCMDDAAVTR